MNSYPPELIVQLAPLMFVAGLDNTQDSFIVRLRNVLLSQRKQAIYQPNPPSAEPKTTTFHVQLVDSNILFPPRKLAGDHGHSPLSPLSSSSPLHPDGIIAPIWVRKHTTLLPCVFVLFLPLSENEVDKDTEREQDTALCSLISSRKRLTSERNIKLTVVLLASRRLLDDPSLEPRLTFIRRQSGLDARASLFVLSPVGNRELGEFVKSLQNALAEVAAEYYAAHGRRVRRKRNKHSQSTVPNPPPMAQTVPIPRPLRPEGWSIRYSYKLAAFAEFRGEFEVALKHYQEAYNSLCLLFSSPGPLPPSSLQSVSTSSASSTLTSAPHPSTPFALPPRTKRWAEAKVLSDCINLKIVKLFLYNNEHSLACAQHQSHVGLFSEMSERRWGIGEATFEFWSWVGRQYRVLAELIDQGLRSTLVLPSNAYKPPKTLANVDLDPLLQKTQNLSSSGSSLNPAHTLLHSGYYYYAAARCAEMRRRRFSSAIQAEAENKPVAAISPGFANEKKVDHLGLVVELYTKAYEVFKSASMSCTATAITAATTAATTTTATGAVAAGVVTGGAQGGVGGRQTLWIAYRIAETYRENGKYDLAVRFFDRLARTYRTERWMELLRGVLDVWFECVVGLGGQVEEGVKVLLELIALGGSERGVDDLMGLLKTTKPSVSDKPLVVELIDSSVVLFETDTIFYVPSVKLSELVAFQIRMTSSSSTAWRVWEGGGGVGRVEVWFSLPKGEGCVVVRHRSEGEGKRRVRKVDFSEVVLGLASGSEGRVIKEVEADLQWDQGETVVFYGSVKCFRVGDVQVSKIIVVIEEPQNGWVVEVPILPPGSGSGLGVGTGRPTVGWWLTSLDPPRFVPIQREEGHRSLTVKNRDHLIDVSFSHHAPAYVDEEYGVDVQVRNLDDERAMDVTLGFLVRPGEDEWVVNWIIVDGERSTSLIKDVELGVVEPGGCVIKRVWLVCTGVRGERVVDVEVLTRVFEGDVRESNEEEGDGEEEEEEEEEEETMEHLEVLVVDAVEPFRVEYEVMFAHSSFPSSYSGTKTEWAGLADLKTFDISWWDERGRGAGEVVVCGRVVVGGWVGEEGGKVDGSERLIIVESIELERVDGTRARVLDSDVDVSVEGLYPAEYIEGDEFCVNCRVSLCVDDDGGDDEEFGGAHDASQSHGRVIEGPGRYCIMWHRSLLDGTPGQSVKTRIDLPTLRLPGRVSVNDATSTAEGDQNVDDESNSIGMSNRNDMNAYGLVALLQVPPIGRLHEPMRVALVVRNESLVRTGNVSVSVVGMGGSGSGEAEGDGGASGSQQQQQFVVAGIKNGRLGVVLPGEEVRVEWVVVPLECGYLKVPKVKVLDWRGVGEGGSGEEVEVFDSGRYFRNEKEGMVDGDVGGVLVLP